MCGPLVLCFGGDFLTEQTSRVIGQNAQADMALSRALEQLRIATTVKLMQAKVRRWWRGPAYKTVPLE